MCMFSWLLLSVTKVHCSHLRLCRVVRSFSILMTGTFLGGGRVDVLSLACRISCRASNFPNTLDCREIRVLQCSILVSKLDKYSPRLLTAGSGTEGWKYWVWLFSMWFLWEVLFEKVSLHTSHLKLWSFNGAPSRRIVELFSSCRLLSRVSRKPGAGRRVVRREAGRLFPLLLM